MWARKLKYSWHTGDRCACVATVRAKSGAGAASVKSLSSVAGRLMCSLRARGVKTGRWWRSGWFGVGLCELRRSCGLVGRWVVVACALCALLGASL